MRRRAGGHTQPPETLYCHIVVSDKLYWTREYSSYHREHDKQFMNFQTKVDVLCFYVML